jgi:hypothetical protein
VVEGRFIIWAIAVTCAQLQLNLRIAVYHVPEYMTTYYQQQPTVVIFHNGGPDSPRRPGVDTFIFGGTTTDLESRHGSSLTESGIPQQEQHNSHATKLVTTSFPQRITVPSSDIGTGEHASLPPLRRTTSFQISPLHSHWDSLDITVTPHAATDEVFPPSATSYAHQESSSGPVIM